GCKDQQVLDWVVSIPLPESEDDAFGDVYALPVTLTPTRTQTIVCEDIEITLYTELAVPSVEELPSWVGFTLPIDTTTLQASPPTSYNAEAGHAIWHILLELSSTFPELGAYFTDEWQENQVWRTLVEKAGDPWIFEMGIFPRSLAQYFEAVPASYQGTVVDGRFGFALSHRWQPLPWTEG
ncbi:MAG: hypothetical protein H0U76_09250, partial [Ktedonobacteraceae bacterium]|nr:hypothetical protein [Ktedonobacteraceae bacterium]